MSAVLAMPILIAASSALDMGSAASERKAIKNALDNAVLAAATNNAASEAEKEAIAATHFERNYFGRATVTAKADASANLVRMTADGEVPVSISEALGMSGIRVKATSAASSTVKNTICVLALDEKGDAAVKFTGELEFKAPSCSVQSNSTHHWSIRADGAHAPIAQSFCAVGGVSGSFSPYAKGQCAPVADPYAATLAPTIGSCVPSSIFAKVGEPLTKKEIKTRIFRAIIRWIFSRDKGEAGDWALGLIPDSGNLTGDDATLYPGTYCNGLTVDGTDVTFMPGEYIIKDGPLTFKNGAQAEAGNVTFAFTGIGSVLRIEEGSDVYVKAAASGPRKGLAFMEMPNAGGDDVRPGMLASMITSGGSLTVLGTLYFPTQKLIVSGSGTKMGAKAPSTSFIAYNMVFEGEKGSGVIVNVDHQAAGLPPILPRSDDGARLVE